MDPICYKRRRKRLRVWSSNTAHKREKLASTYLDPLLGISMRVIMPARELSLV